MTFSPRTGAASGLARQRLWYPLPTTTPLERRLRCKRPAVAYAGVPEEAPQLRL